MEKKRGGARKGAGRPPLAQGEVTVIVPIRMTERQREKLKNLGGSAWVRARIDLVKG